MNKDIDLFTAKDYENINLDYPEGYLKMLFENEVKEKNDLQERIDKAIEYIKTVNESSKYLDSMFLYENYISNYGACELLDILQGSGTQGLKDAKERSVIPEQLCDYIVEICEKENE